RREEPSQLIPLRDPSRLSMAAPFLDCPRALPRKADSWVGSVGWQQGSGAYGWKETRGLKGRCFGKRCQPEMAREMFPRTEARKGRGFFHCRQKPGPLRGSARLEWRASRAS